MDKLREFGVNIEEGLSRLAGNEALYLKLIKMATEDANFDKLEKAIKDNDLDMAFESAHALKGVFGNLAIKVIYDKVFEITELLRSRTQMDYTEKVEEIINLNNKLKELL